MILLQLLVDRVRVDRGGESEIVSRKSSIQLLYLTKFLPGGGGAKNGYEKYG